jgi:catechol 2,3-dioxygenase-like lactoylglutathione lyase family enzyme
VFDHVTIRVSDLAASGPFYRRVFELLEFPDEPHDGGVFLEWNDFSISQATPERPVTRRLHAGFVARSREQVDAWWRALTQAGHRDDGAPGPRPEYGPDYYGAFVLDPDGNSVEAVHNRPRADGAVIDHLWLRVRDLATSRRFYETIAPVVGFGVRPLDDRVQLRGEPGSFSIVEGEPTEHVHLAFPAPDRAAVEAFHRAAVDAGYRDDGAPGERPEYHPGYYGAYVLDPDGNNVEAVFHDR